MCLIEGQSVQFLKKIKIKRQDRHVPNKRAYRTFLEMMNLKVLQYIVTKHLFETFVSTNNAFLVIENYVYCEIIELIEFLEI